jgi:hypothetical protein
MDLILAGVWGWLKEEVASKAIRSIFGLTDAVEKVGSALPERNNGIKTNNILNRCCVFASSLESTLLGKAPKIFFQQYRSFADITARPNVRFPQRGSANSMAWRDQAHSKPNGALTGSISPFVPRIGTCPRK